MEIAAVLVAMEVMEVMAVMDMVIEAGVVTADMAHATQAGDTAVVRVMAEAGAKH